jgi:hypothetical protein
MTTCGHLSNGIVSTFFGMKVLFACFERLTFRKEVFELLKLEVLGLFEQVHFIIEKIHLSKLLGHDLWGDL